MLFGFCFGVFWVFFFWLNRSQGSSNMRCWNTAAASGKIKAWSRHRVGKCPFCCWWGRDWQPDLKLSHRDAKRSALSHPGADISSDSLAFVTTLCPTSSPCPSQRTRCRVPAGWQGIGGLSIVLSLILEGWMGP